MHVGQLDATVNVQDAPAGAKLDAWIDFNSDGSWSGPFDQIADSVVVAEGDLFVLLANWTGPDPAAPPKAAVRSDRIHVGGEELGGGLGELPSLRRARRTRR